MALTPAGRRLLPEARSLLDHAREFESGAAGLGQALAGTLEVGCFVTIAPFFVPRLLSGVRESIELATRKSSGPVAPMSSCATSLSSSPGGPAVPESPIRPLPCPRRQRILRGSLRSSASIRSTSGRSNHG